MAVDPGITNNFLHSCAFDPKYAPVDKASVELIELYKKDNLPSSDCTFDAERNRLSEYPPCVKAEAQVLIYTIPVQLTPNEVSLLRKIETILAGNGKVENIIQDARHVFEAQRYGSYFITTDAGILDRAKPLRETCGVLIVKPSGILALLKGHGERPVLCMRDPISGSGRPAKGNSVNDSKLRRAI